MLRIFSWIGAGLAALVLVAAVQAQEFPSRPTKLLIGFGPGGLGEFRRAW
jgi:tripartite-type tricarboxylate transporter receptor subunit TctC